MHIAGVTYFSLKLNVDDKQEFIIKRYNGTFTALSLLGLLCHNNPHSPYTVHIFRNIEVMWNVDILDCRIYLIQSYSYLLIYL